MDLGAASASPWAHLPEDLAASNPLPLLPRARRLRLPPSAATGAASEKSLTLENQKPWFFLLRQNNVFLKTKPRPSPSTRLKFLIKLPNSPLKRPLLFAGAGGYSSPARRRPGSLYSLSSAGPQPGGTRALQFLEI
ncbi:uncharacterized protein A4U43_C07F19330 [Asparagus officinalis]|uniref:Uncharacterized protein n=1 Tax=Asparagus officinalis TaxID=4686 RepID=A0A5P1ED58_ASPOF|nr:uncharacterized protein A4U43_C07F19330 [Asparagus officinalis]